MCYFSSIPYTSISVYEVINVFSPNLRGVTSAKAEEIRETKEISKKKR
jgi:hypothetical protein